MALAVVAQRTLFETREGRSRCILSLPQMLNGKTEEIEELLNGVREAHGTHAVEPYGDWDDPRSVGFKIRGIPATFSVICEDRLPERHYNIQIESYPQQDLDYLYHERAVALWGFLDLLRLMSGPSENWPKMIQP
jgi:hypothetical protein